MSGDSEDEYPQGLPTGEAVITTGGNLPAQYVIHTVGPIYGRDPEREAELLAASYRNSLSLARQHSRFLDRFSLDFDRRLRLSQAEAAAVSSRAIKEFLESDGRLRKCGSSSSTTAMRGCFFSTTNSSRLFRFVTTYEFGASNVHG